MKIHLSRETTCILLVFVAVLSVVPIFTLVSGTTSYHPGAKRGQWVYYSQITTSWQSSIGMAPNLFIAPYLHVSSINSTVTNVTQYNITFSQLWTFDNGTTRTFVLWGNEDAQVGNFTNFGFTWWYFPGGLSAGDHLSVRNPFIVNETVVANYAASSWAVDVWNYTSNVGLLHQALPFVWEEKTGLLLEESYTFSFSNYASGSLEIKATQTNIPPTNPDFTMSAGSISLTTKANENATTTIMLTSSANLTITLSISSTPVGLSCSLAPNPVNVKTSANATLSCSGAAGTYHVTLTGTSGAKSHAQTLAYQVNGPPLWPATILFVIAVIGAMVALIVIALFWKKKAAGGRVPPTTPESSETPTLPPAQPPSPPISPQPSSSQS